MFKNFNWKRYFTHLIISWVVLMFTLGAMAEFRAAAREERKTMSMVEMVSRKMKNLEERAKRLEEELIRLRADNSTLENLNQQFAKENIRLRRQLALERRARRREAESK